MPKPSFKLSDKFSLGDKVQVCTSKPASIQAEFSPTVNWTQTKDPYLGAVVTITEVDDKDATIEVKNLAGGATWLCHSWVIKHTDIEQIDAQHEGQRQLDYGQKRSDFHMRIAYGWTPPPDKWEDGDLVVVQPQKRNTWEGRASKTIGKEGKVTERGSTHVRIEFDPFPGEDKKANLIYVYKDLKWIKRPHW